LTIRIKSSRRDSLHEELGVPERKKIPEAKINKAERSSSPANRKRAVFEANDNEGKHGDHHASKTRRRVGL
jgi:phage gp16-like protein